MPHHRKWLFLLLGSLWSASPASISVDQLSAEGYSDMGQIVKGNNEGLLVKDYYLNRMGASITAVGAVQDKLQLRFAVGGIFWQTFPPGDFWQNNIKFGPGINEASFRVLFTPHVSLQGGYFPFKYDSPAMNLGEYLLRSESYPTYIATGGWTWVDSAFTRTMGFRLQADHFGGRFHQELGAYWEFENPPLYDVTPAYLFSLLPAKGMEVGGGIALRRWFTPNFGSPGSVAVDTNGRVPDTAYAGAEQKITRRAINVMARVNFDFAKIFEWGGTGPFKFYAEGAVLGVRNQPVYYEKLLQRMPVMMGLHVPTFGVLDLLALEAEYLDNPYPDSKQKLDGGRLAGTGAPSDLPLPDVNSLSDPAVHGDDWKWSLQAVKTVLPGVKLKVQAANDHLRLQNFDVSGVLPSATPQTVQKSQWYYLIHVQWGF